MKIMNKRPLRFYVRTIAFLVLCFIMLQCCNLNVFKSPGGTLKKSWTNISAQEAPFIALMKEKEALLKDLSTEQNDTISRIKRKIYEINEQQVILNENKFGPLDNNSVVIVIQVHKQFSYLRYSVNSLSHARDISKALLVFSHEFYDDNINDFVQAIEFCKVIQMYYPHSLQTHPHKFPGRDPNDCPRNITKNIAIINNCNNALYPDINGHYRQAKLTQAKHHWWWKANRVFHQLKATRYHAGLVLFLEENHFVAEDFLYVVTKMQQNRQKLCPQCNILRLGNHIITLKFSKVECFPWVSEKHNIAIALNRTTWLDIRSCAQSFCTYDDYSWDRSLQHVSETCLLRNLHVMAIKGTRVYPIGKCDQSLNCDSVLALSTAKRAIRFALRAGQFYPKTLTLDATSKASINNLKAVNRNGGWSDPRDHRLCLNAASL
ncbi:alpha-1,6-mannosyl-glycoprotein 2-beta-N-acetylglucosaminyltransferase [Drosophila virilis]|uniref:Alpha-1,6-mannosyl-glycoprotein 2-beta-N-acetylglucosaminyltransferase n=1 Tax=Drosophila virilis TaxID=7244 RepID=B4LSN6_DROVI|nr:alpha-1,6-mannosyl-glycoprotein 2-beta-N-acetylglucosaminyltransferase [Drosophila virilis]XP_015028224.1 alpha-1,6-mannosyl-glycoprotein 2-beta-N-acetylglucosaminyltransferase [Drosophila virilis]XP_015028225.1 alpha-1,6-mannosyl-glycoprotein 2-beta-N-acetylglucosaminyltransferase [Drosophila virilis]EDW63775.2 uncharacterized protein Dvir_GJ16554, isoform C [Drosophila virilis]KRF81281.1 uncharacterized protein Dvir_GJ16554, isoform B [Drosophila virilis]KRF81282.1 uncharacterized protein